MIIGRATSPHGIKGGITFLPTQAGERLLSSGMTTCMTFANGKNQTTKVTKVTKGHKVIIYLEGVDNRNLAEEILPFSLSTEKTEAASPSSTQDFSNMKAYCHSSGEEVGAVAHQFSNGQQTVLEISGKFPFTIPAVENFVKKVDRTNKKIWVVVPDIVE